MGATFNEEVWRQRAWGRYTRSQLSGRPQMAGQWARDLIAISDLNKLINWCGTRGLQVVFSKRANGVYDSESKTITISCQTFPQKQLGFLLHECGHHLIGMKEQNDRFGMGYPKGEDPSVAKLLTHKIAILEEECEAWERGRRLAKRLKLSLVWEEFDALRIECLKSYVLWVADGYGYSKERKK